MADTTEPKGPDLTKGIDADDLDDDELLLGHANGEAVMVARTADGVVAVGATCTHWNGPLAEGVRDGDEIHCPWHHACFSLRTGATLQPPALHDLPRWSVEERDGRIVVGRKMDAAVAAPKPRLPGVGPASVVIIGASGAGNAVAETLRREGYTGAITMVDPDPDVPCDRPNLSKDFMAGNAPEEWIPLHPPSFYEEHEIELRLGRRAATLDLTNRTVSLDDGTTIGYGALVIATGARPVPLPATIHDGATVHYLRTLADSRAIIEASKTAKRAVVIGASFIGLEVAASLRARDVDVHVVAPEKLPLARILGDELGTFIRDLHEKKGVTFHLGHTVKEVDTRAVKLDDGTTLDADLVVAGIGVRPDTSLAEAAGLAVDKGILVDSHLRTGSQDVYAAGDVARWPDPRTERPTRVEHWVVAERLGQTVARNILGMDEPWTAAPFFWSQHYDTVISYVGHAESWERIEIDGDPADYDCAVRYFDEDGLAAVATIFRDEVSLRAEMEMEDENEGGLDG